MNIESYQREQGPSLEQIREMLKQGVVEISDQDYRSVSMPCPPLNERPLGGH